MLHVASVCTPCCVLLKVVVQSLKPVKSLAQCWELLRPLARSFTDNRKDIKMLKPLAAFTWVLDIKPRANGHKIVGCYMLAPFCTPCYMLLGVVAQSFKPVNLLATRKRTLQLSTMLRPFPWGFMESFVCSRGVQTIDDCCLFVQQSYHHLLPRDQKHEQQNEDPSCACLISVEQSLSRWWSRLHVEHRCSTAV